MKEETVKTIVTCTASFLVGGMLAALYVQGPAAPPKTDVLDLRYAPREEVAELVRLGAKNSNDAVLDVYRRFNGYAAIQTALMNDLKSENRKLQDRVTVLEQAVKLNIPRQNLPTTPADPPVAPAPRPVAARSR